MLSYEGADGTGYTLQMSVSAGTTTFPAANASVAFYNSNDSRMEWAAVPASGGQPASGTGTASVAADGKSGMIDLANMALLAATAHGLSLPPINLKGGFTCP